MACRSAERSVQISQPLAVDCAGSSWRWGGQNWGATVHALGNSPTACHPCGGHHREDQGTPRVSSACRPAQSPKHRNTLRLRCALGAHMTRGRSWHRWQCRACLTARCPSAAASPQAAGPMRPPAASQPGTGPQDGRRWACARRHPRKLGLQRVRFGRVVVLAEPREGGQSRAGTAAASRPPSPTVRGPGCLGRGQRHGFHDSGRGPRRRGRPEPGPARGAPHQRGAGGEGDRTRRSG